MAQFLEFPVMKKTPVKRKKSNRGRKKTAWLTVRVGDSWVRLRPEDAATLAGVSIKTVYHWIAGTKTPAPQVSALLEIVAGGALPWRGWEGWRLATDSGRLMAPNGYSFMPGELAWWSLQKQLIKELERDNAWLRIQLEQLRAQVNEQAANNLLYFPGLKKNRP